MKDKIPFILRLICSPLILSFYFIMFFYLAIKGAFLFVKYGGEVVTYESGDSATIQNIYEQLKNKTK